MKMTNDATPMTSQPEALTEAQAAYEAARQHTLTVWGTRREDDAVYSQRGIADELIALQAARIASLEAEVAAAVERAVNVFVVEYSCRHWEGEDFQLIGVAATLERAQELATKYLRVEFDFFYDEELGIWIGVNDERGYFVHIHGKRMELTAAPASDDGSAG